ncbi:MAG TPA: glycosyltransferase family 2 protein [Chlorobaculum sp.]|nr:glycosyltransferase family 2 protein [Chlorobaculum sp.]
MMEQNRDVWILIAAYNEGSVIGEVVRELRGQFSNVAVVDDGSSDRTGDIALEAGAHVIRHPINLGQGAAIQTGLTYGLSRGADYLVTFDADGQHRIEDVKSMFEVVKKFDLDVACGSRFLGSTEAMPTSRRILLKLAILFTRFTTGVKVTDAHNGLRVFSARGAKQISITQNRMAHASEIIEQIAARKLTMQEVPVTIKYTAYSLQKGQKITNSLSIIMDLLGGRMHK